MSRLIRKGKVKDYAELARLGHVTRARVTQIMNLLNLSPTIQAHLLFLKPTDGGETVTERIVKISSAEICWHRQQLVPPKKGETPTGKQR